MYNDDWLIRTKLILGTDRLKKLHDSSVLIVGLGGVGAYAAEMVCRAGVGKLTIIDGDKVQKSNINRQLIALNSTRGMPKAELMGERLKDINPHIDLRVMNEYLKDDRLKETLDISFDYVIDAIDTLSPKVFLIYHAVSRKIPIVSSMGAGGKFDPERISIRDISETTNCSLARILRKRLHKLGIHNGVTAVFSPEEVDKSKSVKAVEEQNKASIVGTISYMPAAFGIACASVVIRDLAGIHR